MVAEKDQMLPTLDAAVVESIRELDPHHGAAVLDELIDLFVEQTAPCIGALTEAVAAEDSATMRMLLHDLKGSSGALGGRKLAYLCDRIVAQLRAHPGAHVTPQLTAVREEYERLVAALREKRSV